MRVGRGEPLQEPLWEPEEPTASQAVGELLGETSAQAEVELTFLNTRLFSRFNSMVCCECLLQLPFFFVAAYALLYRKEWIRIPGVVYGAHVATTLVPILAQVWFDPTGHVPRGSRELWLLTGVYGIYLVFPLAFMLRCCFKERLFPAAVARRAGRPKAS